MAIYDYLPGSRYYIRLYTWGRGYLYSIESTPTSSSMSAVRGGRSRNAGSVELERQVEGSEGAGSILSYNPNINLTLSQQRQRLPVFKVCPLKAFMSIVATALSVQYRSQILYLLEKYRTVVIIGETGSGKTTQVCGLGGDLGVYSHNSVPDSPVPARGQLDWEWVCGGYNSTQEGSSHYSE